MKGAPAIPIAVFRLGHLVATPNARDNIPSQDITRAIQRHQAGDWCDVKEDDRQANDNALTTGARILSVYHASNGAKFWLITEADRSRTTVLLPEDY
jgi:hypothetical protein